MVLCIYIFTYTYMGGDFKYSGFSPYLEKIPILNDIFQWGWNHQLDIYTYITIYIYIAQGQYNVIDIIRERHCQSQK